MAGSRDIGSLQVRRPDPALQLAFLNAPLLNGLNGAADINGGYACDPVRCPGASRLSAAEIMTLSDTSAHSAAAIARLTERVTSILEPLTSEFTELAAAIGTISKEGVRGIKPTPQCTQRALEW